MTEEELDKIKNMLFSGDKEMSNLGKLLILEKCTEIEVTNIKTAYIHGDPRCFISGLYRFLRGVERGEIHKNNYLDE